MQEPDGVFWKTVAQTRREVGAATAAAIDDFVRQCKVDLVLADDLSTDELWKAAQAKAQGRRTERERERDELRVLSQLASLTKVQRDRLDELRSRLADGSARAMVARMRGGNHAGA